MSSCFHAQVRSRGHVPVKPEQRAFRNVRLKKFECPLKRERNCACKSFSNPSPDTAVNGKTNEAESSSHQTESLALSSPDNNSSNGGSAVAGHWQDLLSAPGATDLIGGRARSASDAGNSQSPT